MHQVAGETIEQLSGDVTVDAEVLAEHFWRSGDHDRTWRYALQAADRARTVSRAPTPPCTSSGASTSPAGSRT